MNLDDGFRQLETLVKRILVEKDAELLKRLENNSDQNEQALKLDLLEAMKLITSEEASFTLEPTVKDMLKVEMKSAKTSALARAAGNEAMAAKKYSEAWKKYTEAAASAPPASYSSAAALANRSSCLALAGESVAAAADASRALSISPSVNNGGTTGEEEDLSPETKCTLLLRCITASDSVKETEDLLIDLKVRSSCHSFL
jgi:tetratricopeptide (TPR) repeat protein